MGLRKKKRQAQKSNLGYCWEPFYILAYCGLVVEIQPLNCYLFICLLPFRRQPSNGLRARHQTKTDSNYRSFSLCFFFPTALVDPFRCAFFSHRFGRVIVFEEIDKRPLRTCEKLEWGGRWEVGKGQVPYYDFQLIALSWHKRFRPLFPSE